MRSAFTNTNVFDRLTAVLFALLVGIVLATFRDFGLAWDEPYHERYGQLIWDFIASAGADDGAVTFRNLALYGGLFDALVQVLARLSPFAPYETRHLAQALAGVGGIAGAWAMARWAGGPTRGPQAGFWAVVLLATTPSWFGHMPINPKDIPFAAAAMWTVYLSARTAAGLPGLNMKTLATLGVALGAAMGVRIAGVVLLAYMGALVVVHMVWRTGRMAHPVGWLASARAVGVAAAVVILIALVLTFALWPASWANPAVHAIQVLFVMPRFAAPIEVLVDGVYYFSGDVPWHYALTYLGVKLPLVLLVLAAAATPVLAYGFVRAWAAGERARVFATAALALAVVFPIVFAMHQGTAHYDALRHFLFVVPPLCVWAALGWTDLLCALKHKGQGVAMGAGLAAGVGAALPVADMVALHPYEYVYYNETVDGAAGAQGRFELDYWALSYREAGERLAAWDGLAGQGPVGVYLCGPTDSAARFLPARFKMVKDLDQADVYLAFTRWGCDGYIDAPEVFTVTAAGARLAVLKDLRGGYTQHRAIKVQVRIAPDYPRPE